MQSVRSNLGKLIFRNKCDRVIGKVIFLFAKAYNYVIAIFSKRGSTNEKEGLCYFIEQ